MATITQQFRQATKLRISSILLLALLCLTVTAHSQFPVNPDWSAPAAFNDTITFGTSPHIAGSGDAWVSVFSAYVDDKSDYEIMFSRSNDGASWSIPAPLNTDWATDVADDLNAKIAAGDNGVWICVWQHSGSIHMAKSIDNGVNWAAPVSLGSGKLPSIAFVGSSQWLVAYGPWINLLRSADDGASWLSNANLPSTISKGWCGNTSPCATQSLSNPVIAGSSNSDIVIIGFDVHTYDRPSGYSGPASSYYSIGGFRSDDKGLTFPYASSGYPYFTNLYFEGNKTVEVTGPADYFIASGRYFSKQTDRFTGLPGVSHPNSTVSTSTRIAASILGHWMGLSINTSSGASGTTTGLIATLSTDFGVTWEPTHTIDTTWATQFGQIQKAELESSPDGQFITVYQVTDPSGTSTIWYSRLDRFIADTDRDSVLDEVDQCPDTPEGDVVDANGCSILQNCPCEGPREGGLYKNKKAQKKCLKQQAKQFVKESRLTKKERKALLKRYKTVPCTPSVNN